MQSATSLKYYTYKIPLIGNGSLGKGGVGIIYPRGFANVELEGRSRREAKCGLSFQGRNCFLPPKMVSWAQKMGRKNIISPCASDPLH